MERKNDLQLNFFGELPTAYYNVVYRKGKFYNINTEKEIKMKDGAVARIQLSRDNVLDKDRASHIKKRMERILWEGDVVTFKIGLDYYYVRLIDDLLLLKEGNRFSKLSRARCVVFQRESKNGLFEKLNIIAESLNHCYTLTSMKFYPKKTSHTGNAFKTMYHEGKNLQTKRIF